MREAGGSGTQAKVRCRVIGLGNPAAGDDALGHAVVACLRGRAPWIDAVPWRGDALGLLDAWHPESVVVLVDAVLSGAPPGTLHRLDAAASSCFGNLACRSTHGIGLPQAIELARVLGRLPRRLIIVGIEAGPSGVARTPAAWDAIEGAVAMVLREVHALAASDRERRD